MDKTTRNDIQRATQAGRTLLEESFTAQLEGTYDIFLDGTISDQPGSHLSERQKVTRQKLVAAMAHKRSRGLSAEAAADAYLREAAFTALNRFVALKMLEARKLVQECVSNGEDSIGYKEFTALAPGLAVVEDKGYRLYIETIFDEIGQEVKVLFDRRDVANLLWPDRQTLLELLGILNAPELKSVWSEDEAIGWVYQYFNADEERTKMRAESQAPRNSRELAVRNQFFTPRYVVQFLTDNTLGRTWYEMMQGETKLAHLDYLVRRPNEVFLADGESAPGSEVDKSELNQEELLQQIVYVPFREKKDPRDLRILDPACGSGHFLLYAFELLVSIYEEAWSDAGAAPYAETGTPLRDDFGSLEALRRAMPELILGHNLHGVDIDPRATQIAALALWMRAQRAHNQFGVSRAERPPITKTNVVVAEPMPGDAELVEEFAASLKPAVLGDLFKKMVEEMKLAGELGSLLKIEESIAKAVKDAEDAHRQGSLFAGEVESQDFWDTADARIIAALSSFAESVAGSAGIRRRLFAGDAAQGVAFIELMRKRFDVVLMNPPFGEAKKGLLATQKYGAGKIPADFYCRFTVSFLNRLTTEGLLGEITNSTFIKYVEFGPYRDFLLDHVQRVFVDLGWGVLDANVATALSVLGRSQSGTVSFFDLSSHEARLELLASVIHSENSGGESESIHRRGVNDFRHIPGSPFLYAVPPKILQMLEAWPRLDSFCKRICKGAGPHRIFYRVHWEVPSNDVGFGRRWMKYANGGGYSPFVRTHPLVLEWADSGSLVKAYILQKYPYLSGTGWNIQNEELYGDRGFNYGKKTEQFSCQIMLKDHIFSFEGIGVFPANELDEWWLLGFLNSSFVAKYLNLTCGLHKNPIYLQNVPVPPFTPEDKKQLSTITASITSAMLRTRTRSDMSSTDSFSFDPDGHTSLTSLLDDINEATDAVSAAATESLERVDQLVAKYLPCEALTAISRPPIRLRHLTPMDYLSTLCRKIFAGNSRKSVAIDGVLVDDPGHPADLGGALREELARQWRGRPQASLDGMFSTVAGTSVLRVDFFPAHLKQFTAARRKAPIYWQLATPSASYSVWCYYRRLTRDTFFRVANDYVVPKVDHEERKLNSLRQEAGPDPSSKQRKTIDAQETFVAELRAFATEVTRIAPLWNPNLNDGVIINFAPLWRLVPQHKPWQKECKACWDKLVKGDYDWAHLAMHLWPERVVPKCKEDRSLAIAHGLEDDLWYEDDDGKWQKRQGTGDRIEEIVLDRSSTAVKAALQDLLEAPAPAGTARRKRRAKA